MVVISVIPGQVDVEDSSGVDDLLYTEVMLIQRARGNAGEVPQRMIFRGWFGVFWN